MEVINVKNKFCVFNKSQYCYIIISSGTNEYKINYVRGFVR